MSTKHQSFIKQEFSDIVSHIDKMPLAIGSIKLEETMAEKIKNMLFSSVFGALIRSVMSNLAKKKHEYLLLTEDKLYYLELAGDEMRTLTEYKINEMQSVVVASDNTLVTISFVINGEEKKYQIWQYNVYCPNEIYFTDTENMKKVGEMTEMFNSLKK